MVAHGTRSELVPVELHPEILEGMGRAIVIGNSLLSGEEVFLLIQSDLDVIIGALLPILRSGSSRCDTGFRGGRPDFLELAEGVVVELDWVGTNNRSQGGKKD